MRFSIFTLLICLGFSSHHAQFEERLDYIIPATSTYARGGSNLILDTAYTMQELITDFFSNSCVEPFNITMAGNPNGKGFFQGIGTELGVPAEIMLSTGNITNAIGSINL